jgi:hypothetical protein
MACHITVGAELNMRLQYSLCFNLSIPTIFTPIMTPTVTQDIGLGILTHSQLGWPLATKYLYEVVDPASSSHNWKWLSEHQRVNDAI